MATVVLTHPAASSGIPGTIIYGKDIPYNTTTIADTCECQTNMSVKWLYTLMNETDETVASGEVLAQHNFGNIPTWTVYAIIGNIDTMKHKIEVVLVPLGGGLNNLELQITNNDTNAHDWTANIVRIQLLGV